MCVYVCVCVCVCVCECVCTCVCVAIVYTDTAINNVFGERMRKHDHHANRQWIAWADIDRKSGRCVYNTHITSLRTYL